MDLKRCLEVLELKNATSISQVKHAYRELVHVWHPDRFPSNSAIKKRADEKMREINAAYEKLIAFLSADHQQDKLSLLGAKTSAVSPTKPYASAHAEKKKAQHTIDSGETKAAAPRVRPTISPTAAGRKTTLSGKYVVLGLLSLLVAFSALILNYISDIDQSTFEGQPAMSILNKLKPDTSKTRSIEKANKKKEAKPNSIEIIQEKIGTPSPSKKQHCEIHLKSGNIIIAETWWEQNNMIMYKTQYGIMGIEKDSIKEILSK
jgi:curved DNA-binding protein CbpA